MGFGGITAFGLPAGWRVLIEFAVMARADRNGRRSRTAKVVPPPVVLALSGAELASIAAV